MTRTSPWTVESGPSIETERLLLRLPLREDFEPWCKMMADPEVARFIGGVQAPSQVWRSLTGMAGAWALEGFGMFSVVERESGHFIGRIGPWQPHGWPITEVGWGLARSAWGKGYATEAASAAMDWAFDTLGWTEIGHVIAPENAPSIAVAERLGSKPRGRTRLPAPYEDVEVLLFAQTKQEWRNRAKPSPQSPR